MPERPRETTPDPSADLHISEPAHESQNWAALAQRVQSLGHDTSRIVPIIAHAVAVFGDEHKASHWLSTPLPLFANRTPSEVLESEGGLEAIEQILTRIEHNIPS